MWRTRSAEPHEPNDSMKPIPHPHNLLRSLAFAAVIAAFPTGCSKTEPPPPATERAHHHAHTPPHGGTPVELGNEEYHLEFVRDAAAGTLQAYVLDGHLDRFIRIPAASLELAVRFAGQEDTLLLRAVTNTATGETVGDTALFEAQADWLKSHGDFEAVLKAITIRTKTYTNVMFNFPKGSDAGANH